METVLVVDDNAASRYVLRRHLERRGFAVVEASDGREALRRIATTMPDLAILDVNLPDIDGFELRRRIKALPQAGSMPVLHVSASVVKPEERHGALLDGADAYLLHPVDEQELVVTVRVLLRGARDRQRAEEHARTEVMARRQAETAKAVLEDVVRVIEDVTAATTNRLAGNRLLRWLVRSTAAVGGAVYHLDADHWLVRVAVSDVAETAVHERLPVLPGADPGRTLSAALRGVATDTVAGANLVWEVLELRPYADSELAGAVAVLHGAGASARARESRWYVDTVLAATARVLHRIDEVESERELATALQLSLLPEVPPVVGDLRLAARYAPGHPQMTVGGDWFDAVEIDGKSVVLMIGDVSGQGLDGAIAMSRLQHATRAILDATPDPATALVALNTFAMRHCPGVMATCALVSIELGTGRMQLASCGHLPLAVVSPGVAPVFLNYASTPPLGVHTTVKPSTQTAVLPPGGTLLLYTDGLIERRNASLDVALAHLSASVAGLATVPIEKLPDRLIAEYRSGMSDDTALLVCRRDHAPHSFFVTIDANPDAVPPARREFRRWLDQRDVPTPDVSDLVLALTEAVTNAVLHTGAVHETDAISIEAHLVDNVLDLTVRDRGPWLPNARPDGRGLHIMRALAEVDVATGPDGTSVHLRRTLARTG